MRLKTVKETAEYKVLQRRDDRYAVVNAAGKAVNGDEKTAILAKEGLVKVTEKAPEPAAEEAPAAEAGE